MNTPIIKHLRIEGTLIFDETIDDLVLNAMIIEITETGELIIGRPDSPYQNKAKIVLHGNTDDPKVSIGPGHRSVKKAIINHGLLQIYGDDKRLSPNSSLKEIANIGSN